MATQHIPTPIRVHMHTSHTHPLLQQQKVTLYYRLQLLVHRCTFCPLFYIYIVYIYRQIELSTPY